MICHNETGHRKRRRRMMMIRRRKKKRRRRKRRQRRRRSEIKEPRITRKWDEGGGRNEF